MKIGFFYKGDLNSPTGGNLYDRMILHHLPFYDWEVTKIPLNSEDDTRRAQESIYEGRFDLFLEDELCWRELSFWTQIPHNLWRPRVGLVHVLSAFLTEDPRLHRLWLHEEHAYLQNLNAAIFVSEAHLDDVLDVMELPLQTFICFPGRNHLEQNLFSFRANKPLSDQLRFINVGSLTREKGVDEVLEQLASWKDEGYHEWEFTIIGDGPQDYKELCHRICEERRIHNHVRFLGALPSNLVTQEILKSDVMLHGAYYESFGIALIEAMGLGVPVTTWSEGGPWDIIEHGVSGLLIPPHDHDRIRVYLSQMVDTPELLSAMRPEARRRAKEFPTWEETTQQLDAALRKVLASAA